MRCVGICQKGDVVRITFFAVFAAAILALVVPLTAQSATGMNAMQYYVGTWACSGGTPGEKPGPATLVYTMTDGVLHQMVTAPMTGKMKQPYAQSDAETYDARNNRYVDAGMANSGRWWVGYTTLNGNTENSVDHMASNGKLGHGVTVRTSSTAFTFTGYPTLSGGKPDFKATCHKS